MKTAAIIAAGGIGKRMGGERPKQYLELLGKPIICHTLDRFLKVAQIEKLIIVLPAAFYEKFEEEILKPYRYPKNWQTAVGGETRQDSVRNGLKMIPQDYDVVLVHDACRPFISPRLIEESIGMAVKEGAAIVASPLKETVKKIETNEYIHETLDRRYLWGAQTPQAFRLKVLKEAMDAAYKDNFIGTDEASLVERLGRKVKIIQGDDRNIKITTPEDLIIAKAIAESWSDN